MKTFVTPKAENISHTVKKKIKGKITQLLTFTMVATLNKMPLTTLATHHVTGTA
jgi:hypothetical protein